MRISLASLADLVGGTLVGDAEAMCSGANPPDQAEATEVTLLVDGCSTEAHEQTNALALVTPTERPLTKSQIIVDDPHAAFSQIVRAFRPEVELSVPGSGIHPSAQIDPTANVHASATIGADVVVGPGTIIMPNVHVMPKSQIGSDCVLHTGVTLYEYSHITDRVVIHAGTVIGANGFGYRQQAGKHVPTAQLGFVHIESDVEIGACVTIDRGTYGATRIGQGTKIDNQVMIAHNCQIGRHNLICSQVGIAGSCRTGDHVILAGQVGLKDHITLGDQTIVGAQAGVMEDCDGHEVLLGSPATNQRDQMQIMATERRLPEMRRELKALRKEIDQLRKLLTSHEASRDAA